MDPRSQNYSEYDIYNKKKDFVPPAKPKPRPFQKDYYGGGKRKSSRAICRIYAGTGMVKINRKSVRHYFPDTVLRGVALRPLLIGCVAGTVNVDLFVSGGGNLAQATACSKALAMAIVHFEPGLKRTFRIAGFVTDDHRMVERKHSGHYKARKSYVYVRR